MLTESVSLLESLKEKLNKIDYAGLFVGLEQRKAYFCGKPPCER